MSVLTEGAVLGPYEILAPLASGGMGSVYRARDRRLGRIVAIKVLSPDIAPTREAVARLRREAEAASALNHPSIVTIFDIGETPGSGFFVAMEFIDGANLREWLRGGRSKEEKLEVLLPIARALAAAHSGGIIHRDIKPENIMISRNGLAKLVDFGLAKTMEPASGSASTDFMITGHGRVVGTVAYMSPEQLRGEPLDARTDIFSFGCVLYEAFAGRPPFGNAMVRDTPAPLPRPVDASLARVVARCLETDRALRYPSMEAVAADLLSVAQQRPRALFQWAISGAAVAAIAAAVILARQIIPLAREAAPRDPQSIAILPFRALGSSAEAYVADGISDALTTDLAKQRGLAVIARNSARRYSSDPDLRKTGEELRVRYVLLGSVQRFAQNVRIDARRVDTATEAHVWAEHYERPLSEVFSAEDAIVRAVAAKVTPAAVPPAVAQPSDPRVADLFLRARFFAEDPDWNTKDRSIPLLEQVVQLDPAFLPARVELASQYGRKAFQRDPDRTWEEKAFVHLEKILAQDPSAAAAYAIRGRLRWTMAHGFAHDEALVDFDRAVRLDPNLVVAYTERGSLLLHVGLLDEALADFHRALRLDPFNEYSKYRVARIDLYQQRCAQAAAELEKGWPNDFQLPIALDCAGSAGQALATARRAATLQVSGESEGDVQSALAVLLAKRGQKQQAEEAIRKAIARGEGSSHFHHAMYYFAAAYAQMKDVESALTWLERSSREGFPCYPLFASDHLLDPIRSDPRIQAFLDGSRREWEQRRRERRAS